MRRMTLCVFLLGSATACRSDINEKDLPEATANTQAPSRAGMSIHHLGTSSPKSISGRYLGGTRMVAVSPIPTAPSTTRGLARSQQTSKSGSTD